MSEAAPLEATQEDSTEAMMLAELKDALEAETEAMPVEPAAYLFLEQGEPRVVRLFSEVVDVP